MTRAALLSILSALANAGALTVPQATAIAAAWDREVIGEGDVPAEPIAGPALLAVIRTALRSAPSRIASAYARLRGFTAPSGDGAVQAVERIALSQPLRTRIQILDATRADDVRSALARESQRRTAVLFAERDVATFGPGKAGSARRSAGDLSRWQRAMQSAYAEDAATLARLGAGGELTAAQSVRLARVVAERTAYVDGFAARLSLAAAGEVPGFSERQISSLLVRASGDARALFFENAAGRETAGMDSPVVYYVARDDRGTCGPCMDAERGSPYLVGSAPAPGSVCRGGGHCRCEHRYADEPAAYARLSGASLPLAA